MPAGAPHFPDPEVSFGAFRVLPRTDGKWIVYDARRGLGRRTLRVFRKQKEAAEAASLWHRQGHG